VNPEFIVVDLFCGAGGTTLGYELSGKAIVVAALNHDSKAIRSHWRNHPNVTHFEEDVRTLRMAGLMKLVTEARRRYPQARLVLWASLECTNFSKAKGGQPRKADSRTLAWALVRYVDALRPDLIKIENVVEFMAWGPLDENGKPQSRRNGESWLKWRKKICSRGYVDSWRELNAADYGAYTSRNRLFGIFARCESWIKWPEPTHAKKPGEGTLFAQRKKWRAVREVLDMHNTGHSIFWRTKPLVDKTLERVYAGLIKFVAGGKNQFLAKIYAVSSTSPGVYDIGTTAHTITTRDSQALVQAEFITKYYSGVPMSKNIPISGPAGTIKTKDGQALVFLAKNYSGAHNIQGVEVPLHTIPTKDKFAVVEARFMNRQYSQGTPIASIDSPGDTITTVPKQQVVSAWLLNHNFSNIGGHVDEPSPTLLASRKHYYIVNPSWTGAQADIELPCPTVIARQDKSPLYLIACEEGNVAVPVYDTDSGVMKRIKAFMALYNIIDIKMRMLSVRELLRIQGFGDQYILEGSQADQKKFIGNSVEPHVVCAWVNALVIDRAQTDAA
jgi:DNA (cytosine-5)-methyltransferase 1